MKRAYGISLGALTGIFAVALGCGGVGDADSIFGGGTGGSSSAGSGGAMTTGASMSTATGGDTTGSGSSGEKSSSSGTSGASSSSSTGGGEGLLCDTVTCPLGRESACCWDRFDLHEGPKGQCVTGSPDTDTCATEATSTGQESRIECHDGSQCAGQVCCAHRTFFNSTQSSYFDIVTCKDSCEFGEFKLCDPSADTKCPMITTMNGPVQTVCKMSTDGRLPPNYFFCGFP